MSERFTPRFLQSESNPPQEQGRFNADILPRQLRHSLAEAKMQIQLRYINQSINSN
jgi:hypothetical protein